MTPTDSDRCEICVLEVRDLNVCSVYFPQKKAKDPFFDVIFRISQDFYLMPMLMIGDFNTGRDD